MTWPEVFYRLGHEAFELAHYCISSFGIFIAIAGIIAFIGALFA